MADFIPKIIDCGLSKYVPEGSTGGMSLSSRTTKFGTPAYICPHYNKRDMTYDAKCDICSFGIVLLELYSGLLQNDKDESGDSIMLEEILVDTGTVMADTRLGDWPEECTREFLQLARECTAAYSIRISKMMDVMNRLVAIRQRHLVPSPLEVSLL
jgi:hypothetical protein